MSGEGGGSFGDYVVYVDESGDIGLAPKNAEYPIFVLAFCIFKVSDYLEQAVPAIHALKFKYFGHEGVVLHEREVRKRLGPFEILMNSQVRELFFQDLNLLFSEMKFEVVATVLNKGELPFEWGSHRNPYAYAMEIGLERVFMQLMNRGQNGKKTHIVFESRGKNEDKKLSSEFQKQVSLADRSDMKASLNFLTATKGANLVGLQIADLIARPIGKMFIDPAQPNRAVNFLKTKLIWTEVGEFGEFGLLRFP